MLPPSDARASLESTIDIAAEPAVVYDLITAIERYGEWSPENLGGVWRDGATGAVGDWFDGTNRAEGRPDWIRGCQVAEATPNEAFTFVVDGMEANCTWWSYELEPAEVDGAAGTRLTERWWIVNLTPAMQAATPEQYEARLAKTADMLPATLAAIKAAAEG